jgi:glycosyltransferase involved in cell wall biosynthesis
MTPTVSIIMPAYNAERFIAQAIDSVLAQTWPDWELIVVNDGSTDRTAEILALYSDARIAVVHQPNQGEAVARNVGLDRVRGEYVALLDSDDAYSSRALAEHVRFLEAHPEFGVSLADGFFCDSDGHHLMTLSEHRPAVRSGDILEALVLDASVVGAPVCTMTRTAAILQAGARFDRDLVIGTDWDFWIQLARYVRFGYLDKPTCLYRVHETNFTRQTGRRRRTEYLVRTRLKVMTSSWFDDLSVETRKHFFHLLLVGLLSEDVEKQQEILCSEAFLSLPDMARGESYRMVASDHLQHRKEIAFSRVCLEEALRCNPQDQKSRLLLWLLDTHPVVCFAATSLWQRVHEMGEDMRSAGQHRPRPAPIALGPVGE